jgi:hypothetical protein
MHQSRDTLNYASPGLQPLSGGARTSFIGSLFTPLWIVGWVALRIAIDPSGDIPISAEYALLILLFGVILWPAGCGIYALMAIRRERGKIRGKTFAWAGIAMSLGILLLYLFHCY